MAKRNRSKSTMQLHCSRCGRHYFETRQSGGTKYCPDCRVIVRKAQDRERARRYRERKAKERADQTFEARWQALMELAHSRQWGFSGL